MLVSFGVFNYDINSDLERIKNIKFVYVENIINVSSVNNNFILIRNMKT